MRDKCHSDINYGTTNSLFVAKVCVNIVHLYNNLLNAAYMHTYSAFAAGLRFCQDGYRITKIIKYFHRRKIPKRRQEQNDSGTKEIIVVFVILKF